MRRNVTETTNGWIADNGNGNLCFVARVKICVNLTGLCSVRKILIKMFRERSFRNIFFCQLYIMIVAREEVLHDTKKSLQTNYKFQ
ncbi:hypothetical protein ASG93_01500 [Paenibacillus sp. Soil787]|nr:hypothetical protein ASG93_01500 [Paenibacillus sp. Soil787]